MSSSPKSLGWQTDLNILGFDSVIEDKKDYWKVLTPRFGNFYWGNFLLFKNAKVSFDPEKCISIYLNEFPQSDIQHISLAWDVYEGEPQFLNAFEKKGFKTERTNYLSSKKVEKPSFYNYEIEVRPIALDSERKQVISLQTKTMVVDDGYEGFDIPHFVEQRMIRYQKMVEANLGNWFGAFIGEELVGDLGLYFANRLGRFQAVEVKSEFRKRGIAQTLVYDAVQFSLKKHKWDQLVIAADHGKPVNRLYQSLGFTFVETQIGTCLKDRTKL